MFNDLHALAKSATLMIVITAEGDDLRVSVTPTQHDKAAPTPLRPLSLLGTPDELDAGFTLALQTWRAPRMSILDQAKAQADDATPTKPAAASKGTTDSVPAPKPARTGKVRVKVNGRVVAAGGQPPDDAATTGQAEATASPTDAATTSQAEATALPGAEVIQPTTPDPATPTQPNDPAPEPAPAESTKASITTPADAAVDAFTLELF